MSATLVGDLERLSRPLARSFVDQPHVLEQRQRRIDHARAGGIFAVGQILDRSDEVVAVTRFVGDELEQDQPQLATLEHPSRAPAAPAAPAIRAVAEIELEGAPMALPAAPSAHRHQSIRYIDLDPAARAACMSVSHNIPFDVSKIYLSCIADKPAGAIFFARRRMAGDGGSLCRPEASVRDSRAGHGKFAARR